MELVLVPLDGSALAEQALPYGRLLAELLEVPVRLLAVVAETEVDGLVASNVALQPEPGGAEAAGFERPAVARQVLTKHAQAFVSRNLEQLRAAGVQADCEVLIGQPEAQLLAAARAGAGSPVVVVPHNYDGNMAGPSESVTDRLVEAQVAPVLVVRNASITLAADGVPPRLRRILVPIDTPDRARAALRWAIRLAKAAGAEIVLLHADLMAAHDSSIGTDARESTTEELRTLASSVLARHGVRATAKVTAGLTDDAIVEEASRSEADLIVMCPEAHTWLGRLFESVSDSVRHHTLVPLLLVPRES
jgi:nucleotide-binding universal stress UspA family protein